MSVESTHRSTNESLTESFSEELDPEMVIGAAKTEKVAKESIPDDLSSDADDASEIDIGSVRPLPNDETERPNPEPAPTPPPSPPQDPPQPSPANPSNNDNANNPPEKGKQKDWITVATTTTSAALGMLAVLAASFILSSCITGISPITLPIAIIVGLLGGVACGLTLYFRGSIVNGIDKLINKIFRRQNTAG